MDNNSYEIFSQLNRQVWVKVIEGHFATRHSHVTHYVDMTQVKSQMVSARAAAGILARRFSATPIETIISLDRMRMVGAYLAEELSASNGVNGGQNISVISPEITDDDKMVIRDNFLPYVTGKRILILTDSVSTGLAIKGVCQGIGYYGGMAVGCAAIFGGDFDGSIPFEKIFDISDIEGYSSYSPQDCPLCRSGAKVDAVVNSYGYSKI